MAFSTYDPLYTLKQVGENIWIADGDIIYMDFVVTDMPFSTRMTLVKLEDGSLWVHSPIQAKQALLDEVKALGEVKHLVSPNKIHYAYIQEWKEHFPEATAWASPGVEKRAKSQKINVSFDRQLEVEAQEEWAQEIDQLIFKGSPVIEEVVFFHKESRTLILADLIENFELNDSHNHLQKAFFRWAKVADPDGQTPIDMRSTFLGNHKKARQYLQQMLAWEPEKIILAHGRWYEKDAITELKRAFRWLK